MAATATIPVHSTHRRLVPPGTPTPMFGHPDDGAIWAWPGGRGVLRMHDGVCEQLEERGEVDDVALSRVQLYSNLIQFYWDTARRAPVRLISTYASDPPSVLLAAWHTDRFVEIAQKGGVPVLGGDGFAFDPARGVLVHFQGSSDTSLALSESRKPIGGVTVRELGVDGVWRDVPGLLAKAGGSRLFAGWDGRRGKIVVIDEGTQRTFAWDGKAWETLCKFPSLAWAPWAMALAPRTRELVYVHAERSTDRRVVGWVLRAKEWQQLLVGDLSAFGGAAYDPVADACLVAAPWFGPGTIPTQWGSVGDRSIVPAGDPLVPACGATSSGPPVVWGHGPAAQWQHREFASRCVFAALDGGVRPLPTLNAPALAVVRAGGVLLAVGPTGDLHALGDAGWQLRLKGKLPPRSRGNVGCDPASGRLLLVGGDTPAGSQFLKDVWLYDGKRWREVDARGARPALIEAHVAFHPGLGAWMVVGGRDNKYRANEKVWLCDGDKWTAHPQRFDAGAPHGVARLAWDPASEQMLLVADEALWVHAGDGAWRRRGVFAEPVAVVAYDDHARRVVSYCEEQDWQADVGAWLDAEVKKGAAKAASDAAPAKGAKKTASDAAPARSAAKDTTSTKGAKKTASDAAPTKGATKNAASAKGATKTASDAAPTKNASSTRGAKKTASDPAPTKNATSTKGARKTASDPAPAKSTTRDAEPAVADEVWLRYQSGDVDKFWFARLSRQSVTVRAGKRGKPAQEKVTRHDSAALARAAHERQVRAKLKAGYEHAPEREQAAEIPGRTAWVMKIGKQGDDLFGGQPPGFTAKTWPRCADCGHPMQFVALLHADPERLPLRGAAALAVFACNGEFSGGACETWDADAGCNAAVLVRRAQLARPALTEPPRGPGGEPPIPPLRARKIAYRAQFEPDPEAEDNAPSPPEDSKVGGYPAWLQFPEPPECEACGGPMTFAAQIDERVDSGLNFGQGVGYAFHCPHAAKFMWQR